MANPEHVEILKQGVEVWNVWREENPGIRPDLTQVDLAWGNLIGINFSETYLRKANLQRANLIEADLHRASLIETNLDGADLRANLSEADLLRASLRRANLYGADLIQTDFTNADLTQSDLTWSILIEANLIEVDLDRAQLIRADLTDAELNRANLSGANFTAANLSGVDLEGADLDGTNFNNAKLVGVNFNDTLAANTLFGNVDLSQADGLGRMLHFLPSTIGVDTLLKSKGNIPDRFLKGIGLPDIFVKFYKSTARGKYHSCFISFSHKDKAFARQLHRALQKEGVRCWFAPEDMKIGDKIRARLDSSIKLYDKLLIILSRNSLNSVWVESEVEKAFEEERQRGQTVLFPVRLDEAVMETDKAWATEIRRTRHIGDFSRWKDHDAYQQAFERLLRDLKAE